MDRTEWHNIGWKRWGSSFGEAVVIPTLLFFLVGPRPELLGIAIGVWLLALPIPRRGWTVLFPLGAAAAAVALGFRIQFITNPAGGYFYFAWSAIPVTFLWILAVIGARTELAHRIPNRPVQTVIDVLLIMNAFLLVLISPQTRTDPLGFYLPLTGLVFLLAHAAMWPHRNGEEHAIVAFVLALFGVSGMAKGPVFISLLGPLAMIGVPLLVTAQTHISATEAKTLRIPEWFRAHRYSYGEFVIVAFILTSALSSAAVIAAHHPAAYGLIPTAVFPLVYGWHRLRNRVVRFRNENINSLFGVRFSPLTLTQAVRRVEELIGTPGPAHLVVTPNSSSLLRSLHDPVLRAAYDQADLVLADGIGVVWASWTRHTPLPARVTGADLSNRLMARARETQTRVFLLGGRPGIAARAARQLRMRYPGINIVGTHHGYFTADEEVIAMIAATRPDLVLVGMGVPRQEQFMLTARRFLPGTVLIGVGGTLDLFAGVTRRAPQTWQRLGLEWLYRVFREPRRIGQAYQILRFIALTGTLWVISAFDQT